MYTDSQGAFQSILYQEKPGPVGLFKALPRTIHFQILAFWDGLTMSSAAPLNVARILRLLPYNYF